ncbi:Uncharacterised protein [Vibrio cholerae]|nr:Uncharacterised protein [Vibrio cholerae]
MVNLRRQISIQTQSHAQFGERSQSHKFAADE